MPAVTMQDGVSTQKGSTTMYQITTTTTTSNPDGEYTDQELLNLVNYFEVSRVELKNVGKCISREMCFSILFIAR
jgi:hypothetical protein